MSEPTPTSVDHLSLPEPAWAFEAASTQEKGEGPRRMGSRRRLFLVLFLILALVAAAEVIDVAMARELRRQDRTIDRLSKSAADLSSQVRSEQAALNALSDRLSAAEAELRSQPNLAEVAQRVSHSVFTIQSGNQLGTGFVTSSSDGGTSILVTNFHVIQDVWNAGGRTVSVSQESGASTGPSFG